MTFKPSRLEVLGVYARRIARWRSNSWPFLSGDAFADISDAIYNPPKFRGGNSSLSQVLNAQVLFVNSIDLIELVGTFGDKIKAKVIISGNSDTEFHHPIEFPKSVRLALLQNSFISDNERIFTLPIGIENYRWGVNGNPRYITHSKPLFKGDPRFMVGPFGKTHPIREVVEEVFIGQSPRWSKFSGYIPPSEFDQLSGEFEYVLCPRGNGVDTHRLWETLYRGRVPIVMSDAWSNSLRMLNLPIRYVGEWNELEVMNHLNGFQEFSPRDLKPLWMSFWVDFIRQVL